MRDRFCLIPYKDIIVDKTYTNITEYFLRGNKSVEVLLGSCGVDCEYCSDFELLISFLDTCKGTTAEKAFFRCVNKLIGEDALSLSADELWVKTSEALLEERNKLRATIAASGLESVGIALSLDDEFDSHFARCGATGISPVFCPFGTNSVSLDTINEERSLSEIKKTFDEGICRYDSLALFFSGFSFEEPNEYAASKAYEKFILGQPLSYKERDILNSQLLRMSISAAADNQKDIMMFLPYAPDVRAMGEVGELIDYIDRCNIPADITVFAVDAVSMCMAKAIAAKKYKNITAAIGVCDNGSIVEACGFGELSCYSKASLAKTVAHILGK